MLKISWNTFKKTPLILGLFIVVSGLTAQQSKANDIVPASSNNPDAMLKNIKDYSKMPTMGQVTSVSQLRDVSPTDWAYEALRSLVERYGCIVGYPDRTYRGNRALSRYEFAAGLNACMQQMERLIASSEAVLREDIDTLKRLMKEFEAELATLGARVDNLEGRVAFLEDHQFSTTTKLKGEVIIAFSAFDDSDVKENERYTGLTSKADESPSEIESILSDRIRLALDTSFTGKDKLRTRLSTGNTPNLRKSLGTDQARLNFEQDQENDIKIDRVWYRTPLTDQTTFWVGAAIPTQDIYDIYTPFTKSDGTGSLARANRFNPLIYRTSGNSGIGLKHEFNDVFDITASYLAGDANDPTPGKGIFNGSFGAGVKLGVHPADNFDIGFSYVHSYFSKDDVNLVGGTGSSFTRRVSDLISTGFLNPDGTRKGGFRGTGDPFDGAATTSENVGIEANWRVGQNFNWAAWGGWATATAHSFDNTGIDRDGDNTEIWTWNTTLSFIDVLKDGAILNFGGGQLPRAGHVDGTFGRDRHQAWIVEGNYFFPVNDNISITPGAYAIFNANNHIDGNSQILVGVVRSVFKF